MHEFGLNYRLPDVLCALGSSQLARLAEFKKRRAEIVARYTAAFAGLDGCRAAGRPAPTRCGTCTRCGSSTAVAGRCSTHLRAAGIGVQVNYIPAYWHPVFEDLGYRRGLCPNAEAYYEQELSLPLFPSLTDADVDRVADAVRAFF